MLAVAFDAVDLVAADFDGVAVTSFTFDAVPCVFRGVGLAVGGATFLVATERLDRRVVLFGAVFLALFFALFCCAFVDGVGFSDSSAEAFDGSVEVVCGVFVIMVSQGFYTFSKRILS